VPEPNPPRPFHVLTLTPFYPTDGDDASGCFVAEPLDTLAKIGINNAVFAVQPFYRRAGRPASTGQTAQWFRYFSLPGVLGLPAAGAFLFARLVPVIRELHRSRPIQLIHAHAPLPCGHAAMLLASELQLPYIVSVHGLDAYSTQQVQGRAGEWCRRISRRVYRSARRVICISEHVREAVLEGTRESRTSVVYNGVDPSFFSPPEIPAPGARKILSVGNLIPIKRHDVLIRSFATLSSEFADLQLEIIGEGPERPRLESLANQLNVSNRVVFLGRRSRRQVAESMRQCTIFALPSAYEGLGCVYLEAMATAKPVIGCRGQGIAEIIQHGSNGFLIGPDNDRELALAIEMLLRDENRMRSLGVAARDTILDRLTLDHQADRLARIYRECA